MEILELKDEEQVEKLERGDEENELLASVGWQRLDRLLEHAELPF